MISFTKAFVANGKTFATLGEAQQAELEALFTDEQASAWTPCEIAERILDESAKIMDVLTTTESSKPTARKVNGGRKPRKPKTDAAPAATPELPAQ